MIKILMLVSLLLASGMVFAVEEWTISGEQWDRPRSGEWVTNIKLIAEAVNRFREDDNMLLAIKHPTSEAGSLWAYELRSWLIALGIPSDYIKLSSGEVSQERLKIQLKGKLQ